MFVYFTALLIYAMYAKRNELRFDMVLMTDDEPDNKQSSQTEEMVRRTVNSNLIIIFMTAAILPTEIIPTAGWIILAPILKKKR